MFNIFLFIIIVILSAFIIFTQNTILIPFFVILLGLAIIPHSIKSIKNKDNKEDHFSAYMNLTIFGILSIYFLFLLLSNRLIN